MTLTQFLARSEYANSDSCAVDSLILVYTDTHDVRGPFIGQEEQFEAFDRAVSTGRPFVFQTWIMNGY